MSQAIQCPLCQKSFAIKDPMPGRFPIACPKCGRPIVVTIAEGSRAPTVAPAPEPGPPSSVVEDPEETVEQSVRPNWGRPAVEDNSTVEVKTLPRDLEATFQPPRSLGGYRVGGRLASTRSGQAFRASRWLSRGWFRLAVVKPRWASDPRFLERLAREAYAAAQVEHPNLAKAREFGVAKGFPFAASDAPGGHPLSDPSRGRAGLDRTARAAAILHGGRALRHAHEQGIYHRGLTLDEIHVDAWGLVRLTDLGVGLTPETPEPRTVSAVELAGGPDPRLAPSTPPEPPPAFAREDVAALGRALQTLLGGEGGDRGVPPGLASVARRMADARHEPPYPDMGSAVRALEAELGVAGPFAPGDAEAAEVEASVRDFEAPPMARARPLIAAGGAGLAGLLVGLAMLLGKPLTAIGILAFASLTAWSLVKVRGLLVGDPIFDRAREFALAGDRGDLLTAAAGIVLAVGALWASGLLATWIFLALVAGGLATAYHFAIDRPIAQARAEAVGRAVAVVRGLRRLGVFEDDIRRFVSLQAGPRWEEFFEAIFGYEGLRSARERWGLDAGGRRRPRFSPWRDPIVDFLDVRLQARQSERDRELLQVIEERAAESRGINLVTARRKSHRIAEAMVSLGRQYRRSPDRSVGLPLAVALQRATDRPEDFLAAIETIEGPDGPPAWREALGTAVRAAFAPRARFLLGGVLLAGFLVWMHQNELIDAKEIHRAALSATTDREKAVADAQEISRKLAQSVQEVKDAGKATRDVEIPRVPPVVARRLDGFGLGVAGLILVASSFFGGLRIAAFALPAAVIAAIGPRLIEPGARTLGTTSLMALAVAAGLFALGMVFGRSRD